MIRGAKVFQACKICIIFFGNFCISKAVSVNSQPGTLQSCGVVAVEMNDAAGNKLQMANGKTATITIPIPSAFPDITSSLIPLWHFDDTKGAWKQEGVATK